MKRKIAKFSVLPLLGASLLLSFSTKETIEIPSDLSYENRVPTIGAVHFVSDIPEDYDSIKEIKSFPRLGKSYIAFKEALGFKESGGDYGVINEFGYMGKYQFGKGTLSLVGIYDPQEFIDSPELQEAAFYANASRNKWILRRDIDRSVGKVVNGVEITESGILAAAHLAGPGNVKRYLRSGGASGFKDGFGTSIKHYFKKFAGYDTSFIQPDRRAKAVEKS